MTSRLNAEFDTKPRYRRLVNTLRRIENETILLSEQVEIGRNKGKPKEENKKLNEAIEQIVEDYENFEDETMVH